ncbi:hypothetical protein FRB99_000933 [Tulasnella sp. 403]|nr:hypothetical protein FRB99_000933 [Tulasnella sp. 403]
MSHMVSVRDGISASTTIPRFTMVRLGLYLKAELEGVTDLQPATSDFEWFFEDQLELSTGHDYANFVWKCGACKREASAKFDRFADKTAMKPYQMALDRGQDFAPLVVLDCRGLELTKFYPQGIWRCVGIESQTVFEEVEFEDDEWYGYDEKTKEDVRITSLETKIARIN